MYGAVSTAVLRGTLGEFTADIVRVCENYKKLPEVVYLDCWHGAGHGYAQVLKYPDSLYACIPVVPDAEEFEWCIWVATEELVEPFQNDPMARTEYEPRLESLCTEITVGHAACFRAVTPMLRISGHTFSQIYDYCTASPPNLQTRRGLTVSAWCSLRICPGVSVHLGRDSCRGVSSERGTRTHICMVEQHPTLRNPTLGRPT